MDGCVVSCIWPSGASRGTHSLVLQGSMRRKSDLWGSAGEVNSANWPATLPSPPQRARWLLNALVRGVPEDGDQDGGGICDGTE